MPISDINAPLLVKLKLSGWMLAIMLMMNLLAELSIAVSGIPMSIKACLLAGLLGYQLVGFLRWRAFCKWRELQRIAQADWWLVGDDQHRYTFELQPYCYISLYVVIVHGRVDGTKVVFWVWHSQCSTEVFRRLAVCIRGDITEARSARTVGKL